MIHGAVRWKTCSWPTFWLDPRHELDRRRARADDRDALAGQVVVVVPLRRSERACPRSARRPRIARHGGMAQRPGRVDDERRRERRRRDVSTCQRCCGLVPRRAGQLVAEAQVRRAGRSARRSRAGTPRSPAGASTSASTPGSARRRTSTGARARRTGSPGTCSPATSRRRRRRARARRSPRSRPP